MHVQLSRRVRVRVRRGSVRWLARARADEGQPWASLGTFTVLTGVDSAGSDSVPPQRRKRDGGCRGPCAVRAHLASPAHLLAASPGRLPPQAPTGLPWPARGRMARCCAESPVGQQRTGHVMSRTQVTVHGERACSPEPLRTHRMLWPASPAPRGEMPHGRMAGRTGRGRADGRLEDGFVGCGLHYYPHQRPQLTPHSAQPNPPRPLPPTPSKWPSPCAPARPWRLGARSR